MNGMIDELIAGFEFPAVKDGTVSRKAAVANTRTKSVDADIKPVEDSDHPNGEFLLVLSRDNLDRDQENLWADEWMHPLPAKIHMDTDHAFAKGMSVPYTAGSGVPSITEDGDLLVKGTYAGTEHGQLTRQLVNEGHIWQGSVSYQTHIMDDGQIVRELLNGTFTGVPSNPEAVVLTSKGIKVPPPKDVGDDLLQAVHDAAVALGAQCAPLQQAAKSKIRRGRTSRRAAVLARARARKFQAMQNIGLAVAEAEASAETRWGFTVTAPAAALLAASCAAANALNDLNTETAN